METSARLTRLASCAGCGAKVGAGTLSSLLQDFKTRTDPNLIVGFDKSDDASVYLVNDETALIQTVDFFPPIVDDPYLFGQIAAANAISDIYAMGGAPKLALNLLCVTERMEEAWIREILRGGYDKAYEAGVIISGGHTIRGSDPLYGLAVTGFSAPDQIKKNAGAKPGDVLILTKPLGVGILTTAAKAGLVPEELMDRIYRQMATLNKDACSVMKKYDVHSCTDVTGFGLLGHLSEMLSAEMGAVIYEDCIRVFDCIAQLQPGAFFTRFIEDNINYVLRSKKCEIEFDTIERLALVDPQTNGPVMLTVDPTDVEELEKLGFYVIGEITDQKEIVLR